LRNLNESPRQNWGFLARWLREETAPVDELKVRTKLRQALSEVVLGSSLAGDGLLVRLRSTSIALLAVVAVVGLGLVAFISQLGWPTVLSGPIPEGPELGVVRNDSIEMPLSPARSEAGTSRARRAAAPAARDARDPHRSTAPGGDLAPSRQTEPAPGESSPPVKPVPSGPVAPTGAAGPETVVVTAPADSTGGPADGDVGIPVPRPSEPRRDTAVKSGKGKGHGRGGGGDRGSAGNRGRGREVGKPGSEEVVRGSAGSEAAPVLEGSDPAPEDRDAGSKRRGKGWKGH
jgi:hypothetical protein